MKDWPHFKYMFQSLIQNSSVFSEIEQRHYFLSCLKLEPWAFSKTLPLTGQNYSIIWNQLNEHFDNKRIFASSYLEEIIKCTLLKIMNHQKAWPFFDLFTENFRPLKDLLNQLWWLYFVSHCITITWQTYKSALWKKIF